MNKQPEALWLQPIPPAQRASRQQLVNIANAYFEAVQKNDGKGFYPFSDDCDRIENGSHTTNTPSPNPTTPGIHVTEVFRIENSLIRRVEMIGTGVPYHFNSSWGPVLSGK